MHFPRAGVDRRKSSTTPHYQTFPTSPPTSKGRPPSSSPPAREHHQRQQSGMSSTSAHSTTPLPKGQLAVLAVISLAEQTAFNSIAPYLPQMTASFPDVQRNRIGLYVGSIATSFALAQLVSNFFWGWLSDRIGRKPVILIGTFLTAICFMAFGFCKTLWQAILVQAMLGLVNGNQGIVSSCLGEITDRSNQSKAFTYLPVLYGLGAITGPAIGGFLAGKGPDMYPYLPPNLVAAVVLIVDLFICMIWLEESLQEARVLPPLGKRIGDLFSWVWQFASHATRPSYLRAIRAKRRGSSDADGNSDNESSDDADSDTNSLHSITHLFPRHGPKNTARQVFSRDTMLLLATYTIFQLSNVAYNSLYPIFIEGAPPTGRGLSSADVGFSLSAAGVFTIIFQIGIFNRLRAQLGNKATYRACLGGFVLVFVLMPWLGYKEEGWGGISSGIELLWAELGLVLLIKTIVTVGGLTSALLLITNSDPTHTHLGTLNGLAQTLSAAGRAIGPLVSGGLYTIAEQVHPKGEALAFGVFGGIAALGFVASFGIRGAYLEGDNNSSDGDGGDGSEGTSGSGSSSEDEAHNEETRLLA